MKSWKQFAEWLGVEFNEPFECEENTIKLKITNKGVEWLTDRGEYAQDHILIRHLIEGTVIVKWVPKYGERYFYPDFSQYSLTCRDSWFNNSYNKLIAKNVGIYRTHEQAKAKAIEFGWRELEEEI